MQRRPSSRPAVVEAKMGATIVITTDPPGAKILVNGVDVDTVTPNPIELPLSTKPVKITLKLDGYRDYVFEKVVPNQDANLEKTLKATMVAMAATTPA
jgi:hypothetical protein